MATDTKKVTDFTEITAADVTTGDWLVVLDSDAGELKKIHPNNVIDHLASAYGQSLMDDANAAATLTTLGFSSLAQDLMGNANLAALLSSLSLDGDLATLTLPDNVTISSFMQGVLDDASVTAMGATTDLWTDYKEGVFGSEVATTSGNSVTIDSAIPAEVNEIVVTIRSVSTDTDNEDLVLRFITASGTKSTGYQCLVLCLAAGSKNEESFTSGFALSGQDLFDSGDSLDGYITFVRMDDSGHKWFGYGGTNNLTDFFQIAGAINTDPNERVTGILITSIGGAATFDGGSVACHYKYEGGL